MGGAPTQVLRSLQELSILSPLKGAIFHGEVENFMNLEKYEVGFNIPASIGMDIKDIQTPALVIDLKVFQSNNIFGLIIFLNILIVKNL